ncbi:MAG: hypothetical protein K1X28_02295 [Parachlamydiales bacterium]|nr:hypothetical protein [Parachlamydiales bacterium]
MSYSITIKSDSPMEVQHGPYAGAAQAPYNPQIVHQPAEFAPPLQQVRINGFHPQPPRQEEGAFLKLSAKEVALLGLVVPVYYAATSVQSSLDISLQTLGIAAGTLSAAGAAVYYSSTVRNAVLATPVWVGRQAWRGCAGVSNFLWSHGRGLCQAGAWAFGTAKHAFGSVGKIGTALVSTAAKVVGETSKGLGNIVDAAGNFSPELTGLALTGAAAYYGYSNWGE